VVCGVWCVVCSQTTVKTALISHLLLLLSHFSPVQLCATPWTVARQAPLSMETLQAR